MSDQDLEAQQPSATTNPPASTPADAGAYSRAGRGGAGNFYDAKDAEESRRQEIGRAHV